LEKTIFCIFYVLTLYILYPVDVLAKTSISTVKNPLFTNINFGGTSKNDFAKKFQKKVDTNGPSFKDAFYLSNTLGYPIGNPLLDEDGGYEFGLAIGAGLSNTEWFGGKRDPNEYPAVAPVAVIHGGFGLDKETDFAGKVMLFDSFIFGADPSFGSITLETFRQLIVGGKMRRQVIEEKDILPFMVAFKGVTLSGGLDVMIGSVSFNGDFDLKMPDTNIDPGDGGESQSVKTNLSGDYVSQGNWFQLSTNFQAMSYMEFFKFFSFYNGPGVSLGYGWLGIEATASGALMSNDNALDDRIGGGFYYKTDKLMDLKFDSNTLFHPFPIMPFWTFGIEMNFGPVKWTIESAINLKNRKDVSMLMGVRYQN